jgi:GH43 family beta-xylosidase
MFRKYYAPFLLSLIVFVLSCNDDNGSAQHKPLPKENEFRNPVLTSAPDPWVLRHGEWYYFTHTTGNSIRLYRSRAISDLSAAEVKTIWSPPLTGMNSKNIWAPEIHFINGKWYFYYAADDGNNDNHRMWVLENESSDPFLGTWVDRGKLELPEDRWAIDGTIFMYENQLYFMWSGWEGTTNGRQDIYITTMSDPLTVDGARIRLSQPEYPWEKNGAPPEVNEGPQFIQHEDKIFITFSASGCWTDQYALGYLYADAFADILDPDSWTKFPEPVFQTNASGGAFGPGHNGFFKSPDGEEDWIIYHANNSAGLGCGSARSFRMQKFTWDENGFPVFGTPAPLNSALEKPSGEN